MHACRARKTHLVLALLLGPCVPLRAACRGHRVTEARQRRWLMAARTLRSSPFWSRKPGLLVVLSPTVACLNRPYSASLSSLLALSGTLSFASCMRGKQSVYISKPVRVEQGEDVIGQTHARARVLGCAAHLGGLVKVRLRPAQRSEGKQSSGAGFAHTQEIALLPVYRVYCNAARCSFAN